MKSINWKLHLSYLTHPFGQVGIGVLVCAIFLTGFMGKQSRLTDLESRALLLYSKQQCKVRQKQEEKRLLNRLQGAPAQFVSSRLENQNFRYDEQTTLQALLHSSPHNEALTKRLSFLQGEKNHLRFTEMGAHQIGKFREVTLKQQTPIDMSRTDLMYFLSAIDQRVIGSFHPEQKTPQLIVKSFELKKKAITQDEETYVVNVELIQREMIP